MSYQPIENYGIIGDLSTAALVSMEASVDFLCFPTFDSPTIFAALLDDLKGGRFQIFPVSGNFKLRQRYFPDTAILLTRFLGEEAVIEVSDFMAIEHLGHHHTLVRRVKVVRGDVRFRMVCAPRFDYGRCEHTLEIKGKEARFHPRHKSLSGVLLRGSTALKKHNGDAVAEFKLRTSEVASFVLEEMIPGDGVASANPDYVSEAFKETMNYWLAWTARSQYRGLWRNVVNRSALTLKLLTSRQHGSIVAAPTFGLPEHIGGSRNWDYRYTWIRDASFTLDALMDLGYMHEAQAFMNWMEQRCRELKPKQPLQVMYRIDGSSDLPEKTLPNLEGYRCSSPVRIGNAASKQCQLDIYGELLDAVYIYDKRAEAVSYDYWKYLSAMVEWVCVNWRKTDDGIWEVRGGKRAFLYSRVLCWVALERAMQLARRRSFPAQLVRWHRVRDEIYRDIYENFWNPKLKSFVQYRGANDVDAAALLMPLVRFISPLDPRWQSTFAAIRERLVEDSLVYRYRGSAAPDGLKQPEGTFSMCSFWYVECLAKAGDLRQARFIFEKALGYANHLGLYAEQLGRAGEHLGNFPQAFSHIALISAALTLDEKLTKSTGATTQGEEEQVLAQGTIYAPWDL